MSKQNGQPSLSDYVEARIQIAMASMNCVGLGTIQSFDAATQTATVSMNYKRLLKDAAMAPNNIDTQDVIAEYPQLIKCPVIFLGGSPAAYLTFPVAVGDPCVLLFADRDIDTWLTTGVTASPPNSARLHSLSDAIAIVGIRPTSPASPIPSFNTLIASLMDKTGERLAQAGDVKATARSTAPSGWLLCYGQLISKTTYDILFSAIGYTYGGSGDNFNLPDLRGRTVVGLDNMGGSQAGNLTTTYTPNRNTLGGIVGEEAHQITIPELAKHTHTYNQDYTGSHGRTSGGDGYDFTTGNTGVTGGDVPHNTVQPGMMLNWIIKV